MSGGVIECDGSIAVDVRKERPADNIIAAINIDRGAPDHSVASVNRDRRVIGHGGAAGNVHVDGGITADAATRVIDLSSQRIRGNVRCG